MDPNVELFDLCDEDGRLTGQIKPRARVHRDGDWHRAFHCWVVVQGADGRAQLIMQRRSLAKSTWQGLWDVSVGGHYTTGEGLEGGLREIAEELGIVVQAEELVQAARRREQVFYENGVVEREVQDVYFLRRQVELLALRPDFGEVIAVALVPAASLPLLALGTLPLLSVSAAAVHPDGHLEESVVDITADQLVPRQGEYHHKVAQFAERLLHDGSAPQPVTWW
ncbi:MAG: hypothetical protein QOF51_3970 [Chloroflexota bacterium]|nr:hypothetical protein [Chloroflexota bacterium]